jgi:hypothetical protein
LARLGAPVLPDLRLPSTRLPGVGHASRVKMQRPTGRTILTLGAWPVISHVFRIMVPVSELPSMALSAWESVLSGL